MCWPGSTRPIKPSCGGFNGASRRAFRVSRGASAPTSDQEYGNGARLDNGYLVLSKIGRLAVRWSRPLEGTPKTVTITRAADGWSVAISRAEAPLKPLPLTGQETGIDLGLESFATLADGRQIANPRLFPVPELNLN